MINQMEMRERKHGELGIVLLVGKILVGSGAEIYRAEDTMYRIGKVLNSHDTEQTYIQSFNHKHSQYADCLAGISGSSYRTGRAYVLYHYGRYDRSGSGGCLRELCQRV